MRTQALEPFLGAGCVAPSYESPEGNLRWKIEVWGRVALRPDFMHPFPLNIVA